MSMRTTLGIEDLLAPCNTYSGANANMAQAEPMRQHLFLFPCPLLPRPHLPAFLNHLFHVRPPDLCCSVPRYFNSCKLNVGMMEFH